MESKRTMNECNFISRNGICGRRCYREKCSFHVSVKQKFYVQCMICGKNTYISVGLCNCSRQVKNSAYKKAKYNEDVDNLIVGRSMCAILSK